MNQPSGKNELMPIIPYELSEIVALSAVYTSHDSCIYLSTTNLTAQYQAQCTPFASIWRLRPAVSVKSAIGSDVTMPP